MLKAAKALIAFACLSLSVPSVRYGLVASASAQPAPSAPDQPAPLDGPGTPRQSLTPSSPGFNHGSAVLRDPALNGLGQSQGGVEPYSNLSSSPVTTGTFASTTPLEIWRRTNPIGQAIRDLAKDGIIVRANYIEDFAGNPVGGEKQGFTAAQWADVGADFELGRLIGWKGAVVHLQGAWFWGKSVGRDYVGNAISFQQTWRQVPGPRLTVFDIEQNLLQNRLNIMVGRAAVNSFYATSPLNCDFMSNTSCLALYGPITDIGITAFPNSSWAGKVRYAFTNRVYGQIGVFEYDNALNAEGRGGLDFATGSATGFILPGEVGYETNFSNDRYPRRYRAGFYYNSASNADPYFDKNGGSFTTDRTGAVSYAGGRVGLYSVIDQTVWRLRPGTQDNLTAFGRVFYNAGNVNTVNWFVSGGFVLTGPFPDRHADTIGLLLTDTHFSSREIRQLALLRRRAGGAGNPVADEFIGELNYGYQIIPGLRAIPNVQWDINPDPINAPRARANVPNAVVVGLKIDVHLSELFGGRYAQSQ